jgi:hypothetical protein
MSLALYCSQCALGFDVPFDSPAAAVLDRVAGEGPWSALGDGETTEDTISTALHGLDGIACPCCGGAASVTQQSLSAFARELLVQW